MQAGHDVYAAHQILLRGRMERVAEAYREQVGSLHRTEIERENEEKQTRIVYNGSSSRTTKKSYAIASLAETFRKPVRDLVDKQAVVLLVVERSLANLYRMLGSPPTIKARLSVSADHSSPKGNGF